MQPITEEYLRTALRLTLAQRSRGEVWAAGSARAAVLVPFVFRDREAELLLTLRTDTVETHKGQVSFPGGVMDLGDADAIATALRETEEEVGLPPSDIEPLGLLDDVHTPTGFIITPVVGIITQMAYLRPNPHEVAEVFFAPYRFFAEPGTCRREERFVQGRQREVWLYDYGGRTIWGATAAIIRSLMDHTGVEIR